MTFDGYEAFIVSRWGAKDKIHHLSVIAYVLHQHAIGRASATSPFVPKDRAYAEVSAPFMRNCLSHDAWNNLGRVDRHPGAKILSIYDGQIAPRVCVQASRPLIRGTLKPSYTWRFELMPWTFATVDPSHWMQTKVIPCSNDLEDAYLLADRLGIVLPPFSLPLAA